MSHNPIPSLKLKDKVAIVTGGASGFGLGIVHKFLEEGAHVVILDLPSSSGSSIESELKPNVKFVAGDVTSLEDWQRTLAESLATFGRLDVVVNNAGACYTNKPTLTVTSAEFDKVFNINVKGVFLSTQVVLPHFLNSGGGSFIQISSTAALRPRPNLTWYNATKGAVSIASKSMAVEYGPQNVRFNCICPVAGDTPLLKTFMGEDTPERRAQFIATIPLQRFSQPSDIANAVAFLASDDAKFITGVDLEVDGGRCV
ncbi:uncharacterized protein SAPINGB_P004511 [Magnusiomyces paraingens]|uniref:Uncharacterized protein n=1 Tax=Magnusiomyces paraingens TaxID=2606893 RepID=A0A5E8BU65_9ASCO|nr:uncharacterized protein SAPINGB_P004511 [Saprochaete ingens]VVT55268.1 unnamed protein product [Saprochaete ingens]